jgi:hypothetical protein
VRHRSRDLLPGVIAGLAVLIAACGRESLSRATDASVDRPVTIDQGDESDALVWIDTADRAPDARPRDSQRDTPVDAAPDGPCQPGFGLCPSGTIATCIDQRTNQNCGACGRMCQAGSSCVDGACVSVCPAGATYCAGATGNGCVNLAGSQDHCGRCGRACGAGQICRDATCQPACRATLAWDLPEVTFLPSTTNTATWGDLDGDSDLDAIVARTNPLELWRNQGHGRADPWTSDLPILDAVERPANVKLGDFNGDGRKDLLLALYAESSSDIGSFLLLTATPTGGLERAGMAKPPQSTLGIGWAVADMDGDRRTDLVVFDQGQVSVWLGQGNGTFSEGIKTTAPSRLYYPLLADMNGDGIRDVVGVSTEPRDFHVFLGAGDGRLAPAVVTTSPEAMVAPLAIADPNGDGMPELIVSTEKGALLLQGTRDGRLTSARALIDDSHVYAAAFFDVNRDGNLDFIGTTESQELRFAYGNGKGEFGPPQRYACPQSQLLTVDDFDRDGHFALALYASVSRTLQVFKGRDGAFPGLRIIPEGEGAQEVTWSGKDPVSADLNQDGVPDLVQLTTTKSVLEITLSGGVDAGQPTVSYPAPSVTSLLVLDIDGDGHLDVALPSPNMAVITILLGRGDGTFEQRLSIPVAMASDSVIGFSQSHPGRGRDLFHKRVGGTTTAVKADPIISVATSTGRACPSSDAGL